MNKTDLVSAVAESQGLTKKSVAPIVDDIFDKIETALRTGAEVRFMGFGSFFVRSRAAHEGRNPATGKAIKIASSKSVGFRPHKELKARINRQSSR